MSAPRLTRLVVLSLLFASATGLLRAQETRPDSTAQVLESMEVRGARTTTVAGGASVLVVRPDSMRLGVAPTLAALLHAVPQVHLRTNSRGEVELSVRGSESRQVSIQMNGLPLSPSWDGRADPSLIPLSGVSEMTYVRSTGTVLGGPNAIGGVVALHLGAPVSRRERTVMMGSDGTGARLFSASAGGSGRTPLGSQVYARAGIGYRAVDGLARAKDVPDADPGATLRTNTDLTMRDGFATVGLETARGAQLSLLVSGYDAERGVAPELHLSAPRLWRYPAQSRSALLLRGQTRALTSSAGRTTLDATLGVLDASVRIEAFSDQSYSTVSGRERGKEQVRSGRVGATHLLPSGLLLQSAFTMNEISYDETLNAAPTSHYAQRLTSGGVEAAWGGAGQTQLSAGVVLDGASTLESGGKTATPERSHVGWRLGASRSIGPSLRAHANVSERARFPALRELYSGALDRFEPNPALHPERLQATEAGISFGSGFGFSGQVVAFHHRLEDAVVRVPYLTTNRFIRVNRDELRSVGSELSLGWRGAGGSSFGLELMAQQVRVRDQLASGAFEKPEHIPSVRALLEGAVPVRAGLVLGADIRHLGAQYCTNAETSQQVALEASAVAGASVRREWALRGSNGFRAFRAVLALHNILDAAAYEQCGYPRAGRTLRVGIELR
jgi:iron complex outermembrane receptor protein